MINRRSVRIDQDGELLDGLFCAYCGEINDPGADSCEHCGQYIADQGPDLSARLHRISRYASSVHEQIDNGSPDDLIGSKYIARPARSKLPRINLSEEFWREFMRLASLFIVSILIGLLIIRMRW